MQRIFSPMEGVMYGDNKRRARKRIPRRVLCLVLFLSLAGSATLAAADVEEGKRFFLLPTLGIQSGTSLGKLLPLPNTADVPEIEILLERGKPVWGLSLGYRINGRLWIQGGLRYGRAEIVNDVGIGLTGRPLGKVKASDAETLSWTGALSFNVLPGSVSPFLSLGVGAITLRTEAFGSATSLLLIFGAGAEVSLFPGITGVLEIRDDLHFFDFAADFDFAYAQIYSPDMKTSGHSPGVHLGLKFGF